MKAWIVLFLLVTFIWSCSPKPKFTYEACYEGTDSASVLDVSFDERNDSVFVYYVYAMDYGAYLNAQSDSTDWGGVFRKGDVKNGCIKLKLKSYRNNTDVYDLELTFNKDGKELLWHINNSLTAYMPREYILKPRRLEQKDSINKTSEKEITIKSEYCYLYNEPNDYSISKAYVIKGDTVTVLAQKNSWIKVSYYSQSTSKTLIKWIKKSCIE